MNAVHGDLPSKYVHPVRESADAGSAPELGAADSIVTDLDEQNVVSVSESHVGGCGLRVFDNIG